MNFKSKFVAKPRPSLIGILILLAGATLLAIALSPSAHAATMYAHGGEFGGPGTGPGLFNANPPPARIAVHEQSGKVFVADSGNHRIQVFNPIEPDASLITAEFAFEFGDSTVTNTPIGIALDQTTGDVYVTTAGAPPTGRVVKFNPDDSSDPSGYATDPNFSSSAFPGSFGQPGFLVHRGGIAVDPTSGDIILLDPGNNWIWRFDSDGDTLAVVTAGGGSPGGVFSELWDLSVNSVGDVIVADRVGSAVRIERFSGAGAWLETLDPAPANVAPETFGVVVAVNPATDEVFASSKPAGGDAPMKVLQFEFDSAAGEHALVDELGTTLTGLEGRFNGVMLGMAARGSEPGRFYAFATDAFFWGPPRVQAFDAVVPPTVAIAPVHPATVTDTEATFTGAVNPEGQETTWWFEYGPEGTDTATWEQVDDGVGMIPAGTLDVDVEATATGLEPNTDYEVRLCAETAGQACTGTEPFSTDAAPPIAQSLTVIPGGTMASLRGRVNPRNSETLFRFEYRLSHAQEWTRGPDGKAGDGGSAVPVHGRVEGLQPHSSYEVRLVAENQAGIDESGIEEFETSAAPAARALELASPLPTGGVAIGESTDLVRGRGASEDGERVLFATAFQPLPGFGDTLRLRYLSERGSESWATRAVDEYPSDASAAGGLGASVDGSRVFFGDGGWGDYDPDDQNQGLDIYMRGPDGNLTWITRDPGIPIGTAQTDGADTRLNRAPIASSMSADGHTVVFASNRNLLDADPHPSNDGLNNQRLYKWSDGELSLVNVLPDGSVPLNAQLGHDKFSWHPNAVSRDGSRVFWRDASGGAANHGLYVQVDGEAPLNASASQGGASGMPATTVNYAGAATDGSRVFFTTNRRLTHDSGGSHASTPSHADLYVFDVDAALAGHPEPLRNLTPRLDGGNDPQVAPDVDDRARVLGVAAVADVGTHIYFVANGQLDAEPAPDGSEPSPQGRNLYLAELDDIDGVIRTQFIAGPLSSGAPPARPGSGDAQSRAIWDMTTANAWDWRQAFASPDGSVLGFASFDELIPGQATGGDFQAHVYDDVAGTLVCASCPPDGSEPVARVNTLTGHLGIGGARNGSSKPRWVATDGTVFFHTPTPLLGRVTNQVDDVYAYRRGELVLVSSGTGRGPSLFHDASADGRTVFFRTAQSLVPQDDEPGTMKLYAARVGGGFPAPPTPQPPCMDEACQGQPSASPDFDPPESSGSAGPGNPPEASIDAARLNRKQVRRLSRGKRIGLRAEVSGPGRVAVIARARIRRGGNMVRVGRAVGQAREAGEVRVRGLRLNRRAMRALRNQGRMVVRIVARYRGETSGQRVRLGNPKRSNRRAKRSDRRTNASGTPDGERG